MEKKRKGNGTIKGYRSCLFYALKLYITVFMPETASPRKSLMNSVYHQNAREVLRTTAYEKGHQTLSNPFYFWGVSLPTICEIALTGVFSEMNCFCTMDFNMVQYVHYILEAQSSGTNHNCFGRRRTFYWPYRNSSRTPLHSD